MQTEYQEQLDSLDKAIHDKRWTQVDEIWQEEVLASDSPLPLTFHTKIIAKLINKQQLDHFNKLYQPLLDKLLADGHADLVISIVDHILKQNKDVEWMRARLLTALDLAYGDLPDNRLENLVNLSGLRDENLSIRVCMQKFEDLLGARRGQVFLHGAWGIGVVNQADLAAGRVVIDFALKKNQIMTLEGVRNYLKRIPADHLRARLVLDPAEIRRMVESDASALLQLAAESYGGRIKVADMKKLLLDRGFITENEYKSFWNRARKALKIDPWLEQASSGVNAEVIKRQHARGFFDEIINNLASATTAMERREVLRDVSRHGDEAKMKDEDREALFNLFVMPLEAKRLGDKGEIFKHGVLFAEYADLFGDKDSPIDVAAMLRGDDVVELIGHLETHEGRRLALDMLLELRPDEWGDIFSDVVLTLDPRTVSWAEKIALQGELDEAFYRAIERILAKPNFNPDLFLWAARQLLPPAEGTEDTLPERWRQLRDSITGVMIVEEVLSLIAELIDISEDEKNPRADAARSQVNRLRAFLSDGNSKNFRRAVLFSTLEEARRLLNDINLHSGISAQLKTALESILTGKHPKLRNASRSEIEEGQRRPDYHYTTEPSMEAQRAELSRLRQEVRELSGRIEEARLLGDLKENAEYHAAKDRQKTVNLQSAELEDLIARARMVSAEEIRTDDVRFGTRISLRETATGNIRRVGIVGMWEANPEQELISYMTPFGSQLLGRKVGDIFTVKAVDGRLTEYEAMAIELAVAPDGTIIP